MDRITDSGSVGCGSIPHGAANDLKQDIPLYLLNTKF